MNETMKEVKNHESIITKAGLARLFGVNQSRINALLNENKIVETKDGKIDLDNPINKAYIEERKTTVPKYTGQDATDNNESNFVNTVNSKKDLDVQLLEIKIEKEKKADRLMQLSLDKALKNVVDTELLQAILTKSYEYFYRGLLDKPKQIIEKLRHIILSGENTQDEDVQLLIDSYVSVYKDGLEQTRKTMLALYEDDM